MSNTIKAARKWSYISHSYAFYQLPEGACLYTSNMDKVISCAQCGHHLTYGNSYSSLEIHNKYGLGYGVCGNCHDAEMKRRLDDE